MAEQERSAATKPAEQQQQTLAPVRVYEYIVPGGPVVPARTVWGVPRRPVPPGVVMLYRYLQQRYGLR